MSDPIPRLNAALEGRYRIERELGEGGMATVYLADDLKHERKVALKVLKPELAAVVGAERFLAEIKTTANLQHPHILPLFDSGEADGFLFYVMPFVEGESLRERLEREREFPVKEAVRIAGEVADALAYAHRRGVIHRDIKPENVLLHEGRSQVADFGIALALSSAGGTRLTETGLSIGTPSYMSPEQATGDRSVDGRTDIYSLGCLLYEMLSGQPPHTGGSAQAILASVLTSEPRPLRSLRPKVPAAVDAAVREALARIPADRPSTAEEFIALLARPAPAPAVGSRGSRLILPLAAGAAAAAVAFFAGARLGGLNDASVAPIGTPRQVTYSGYIQYVNLSPDGRQIVYQDYRCADAERCRYELVLQDLESGGNPVVIEQFPPEYGTGSEWYWSIAWSPSGDELIFTRSLARDGLTGVYLMPPYGGAPRMLRAEVATGAAFRPDGQHVDWVAWPDGFDPGKGVWRTLHLGSDSMATHFLPSDATELSWSPSGELVAFVGQPWDEAEIVQVLQLAHPDGTFTDTRTAPPGRVQWPRVRWVGDAIVFMSGDDFYRLQVDLRSGTFVGEPEVVFRRPLPSLWGSSDFDVSSDGQRLVWAGHVDREAVVTINPTGVVRRIDTGTARAGYPAVSPDGSRVAYIRESTGGTNVYLQPFGGGQEVPLTGTQTYKRHAEWSPDGRHIAFTEQDEATQWLSMVTVDGGRPRRLTPTSGRDLQPRLTWMPDSDQLVFAMPRGELGLVDLDGSVEVIGPLPDSMGILWDVVPSAAGDSVAVISHLFAEDDMWLNVYTIAVDGGRWHRRNRISRARLFTELRPASSRFPGWISVSAGPWVGGGPIPIAVGPNTGIEHSATVWGVGGDTSGFRRLADFTEPCGGPTTVVWNSAQTHWACERREHLSDAWVLDGFLGREGGSSQP